ncbi:radical SAM/SPASM domain-containing protein [Arenibacterium halophilum]|uniref:SPASM domain-containing protein n=1 Tax=Arenibacterium halophilum TaxID=2583821 RepID=A0ABY2XCP6_9RHOB|nr:radical SAM protein [Arenibacterium halophilum]TMV13624.1 SPASM domain-containing protein [Arenibacterium halophilum]
MPDGQFIEQTATETRVKPSLYTVLVPLTGARHLAYNTVSQSFSVWDARDMALWQQMETRGDVAYGADYRGFVQGGYVVNANTDERAEVKRSYDRTRTNDSHMMVTIAPTLSCNFGCHYCFQGLDKPLTKMTPKVREATKAWLMDQLEGRRSFHMTWYGGEPLMDQDTIWDVSAAAIAHCDAHGIKYTSMMISNGYKMTVPVAEKLKKARVGRVQITIDGDAAMHDSRRHLTSGRGTFDKIIDNIRQVTARRLLKVSVRVNIDGSNEAQARALLDVLQATGLGLHCGVSVYFAPVESIAENAGGCDSCLSKTDYADVENRLQELAFEKGLMALPKMPRFLGLCTAVKPNSYVVVPNGDLHKCWDTVMDSARRVGSVISAPRRTDTQTRKMWDEWTPFDNAVCAGCKLLPSCGGACAFKFIHNDYASGETGRLPCPSLKFNMAEQLFLRAKARGFVSDDDWDQERSPTVKDDGMLTGDRHTFDSIQAIHGALISQGASI